MTSNAMWCFVLIVFVGVSRGEEFFVDCSEGFLCENWNCIEASRYCDSFDDCGDGSDEIRPPGGFFTNVSGIACRQNFDTFWIPITTICILAEIQAWKSQLLCKIGMDCSDGFLCENKRCIAKSSFCDGNDDCWDGFDEISMDEGFMYSSEIAYNNTADEFTDIVIKENRQCKSLYSSGTCVLPQNRICDGANFCEEGVDECLCRKDESRLLFLDEKCFRCLKNSTSVIPLGRLCDGIFDCSDLTDECLCNDEDRPAVCDSVQWEEQIVPSHSINCTGNVTSLGLEEICDEKNDCENEIDEKKCSRDSSSGTNPSKIRETEVSSYFCFTLEENVTACDRVPECFLEIYEEECLFCPDKPRFCNLDYSEFGEGKRCLSGSFVIVYAICDGISNCETNEDELDCADWFHCKNETNGFERIKWDKVCDTVEDCADGSDEGNYQDCPYFTCNDGGNVKYIDNRQVCDGTPDCAQGSDECQDRCITSVFSDTESMIKNQGIVGFVWIISFAAVLGNIAVMVHTIRVLINERNDSQVAKSARINKLLILNLSVSDLIVGIYILAIVVRNTDRERYCLVDQDWRSSSTCSAIGSLLVIGSQQSVLTMVIITVFRTLGIIHRHKFEPRYRNFGLVIIASWIVSISLALIPLMPSLEDYFIDSVWYKDNKLFTTINKERVENLTNWLTLMHENTNSTNIISNIGSWTTLEMLISELNPNLTVQRRFGFYSTHAVCLPTFFPDRKTDTAWWYSVLIITINFVSFVAVFVGSVIIYRSATAPSVALRKDVLQKRAAAMQAKLSRIVITDFCCWMPVCIMAFIQLSGIDIPNDAYIPIALIVIPINSSLNPFLYSNVPDKLWEKLKNFYVLKCGRPNAPNAQENPDNASNNRVTETSNV